MQRLIDVIRSQWDLLAPTKPSFVAASGQLACFA